MISTVLYDIAELFVADRSIVLDGFIVGDVRMVNNVENNRLELHFPNRTSKGVYELLKSHGFRYTPSKSVASAGCFQAFRGRNADHWAAVIIAQYNAEAGAA